MRCVILASGSGSLTQAVLDAFSSGDLVEIVAIGSDQPDAPVLRRAERAGVATFVEPLRRGDDRTAWNARLAARIAEHTPDWIISAGFMRILGAGVLDRFPERIINIHPALLPAFPGAHAVRDALGHGVRLTGSTIHLLDAGVDTGPIISQRGVAVRGGDDESSLHERIRAVEREELVAVLRWLATGDLRVEGRRTLGYPPLDPETTTNEETT